MIGNTLGTFLYIDMSFFVSDEYAMAPILVQLNMREGLAEDLELATRGKNFKQRLDYEGVSFRCRRCHKQGHIVSQCPLHFK